MDNKLLSFKSSSFLMVGSRAIRLADGCWGMWRACTKFYFHLSEEQRLRSITHFHVHAAHEPPNARRDGASVGRGRVQCQLGQRISRLICAAGVDSTNDAM